MRTASRCFAAGAIALFAAGCTGGAADGGGTFYDGSAPLDGSPTATNAEGGQDANAEGSTADADAGPATNIPDAATTVADAGASEAEAGAMACHVKTADCTTCEQQYCDTVVSICQSDATCNDNINTFRACACKAQAAHDDAGLSNCKATFSQSSAQANTILNCAGSACQSECAL